MLKGRQRVPLAGSVAPDRRMHEELAIEEFGVNARFEPIEELVRVPELNVSAGRSGYKRWHALSFVDLM